MNQETKWTMIGCVMIAIAFCGAVFATALVENPGLVYETSGTGTMTATISPGSPARIDAIYVTTTGPNENKPMLVKIDSWRGAAYDFLMPLNNLAYGNQDHLYPGPIYTANTDTIAVSIEDANILTWKLKAVYATFL
jgi:hypothetical protein